MDFLRRVKIYQRRYLKFDLMSGFVVFLVAIPLCLGIALASGAPLFSGIIAGIIGGIVVGSISESSVSVSGPAAGMVAIVLAAIAQLGGFQTFLFALVIAGILQILIGLMRAGFIADYIPSNVIQGLLCAIGILIIIKQLPLAFTHPEQNATLMAELKLTAQTFNLKPLVNFKEHINLGATIISLISLVIMISMDKLKNEKFKIIPGPVVVVIVGVIINALYNHVWSSLVQNSAQLVNIPVNGNAKEFFSHFQWPAWQNWINPNVYLYGILIAALASLETLLNLEAAEKLDKRKRYCSRNRELIAQGVGNTISGLIGGIAITSVVVRTSVNIQTGVRTKLATIIHGLLILIVVAFLPYWLNKIPLASLAIILIYVGYKLTNVSIYKEMYRQGLYRFLPFLVTVLAIVFTNLLLGILIGLFVSLFFILKANSQIRFDIIQELHPAGVINRMILPQMLSFLKRASLIAELDALAPESQLIIDARYAQYIDRDILEVIKEFKDGQAIDKKIALNLVGFKERYDIHDHIDFINVTTFDVQAALTSEQVLKILQEGNQRFLKDQRIHRSLLVDVKETAANQHPIGVVLSCIDSRVPVETIFDVGLGDLFSVRVAGNIINNDIIASIEFACSAGAKLILILGHTRCGAIHAACERSATGYVTELFNKIEPAIEAETSRGSQRDCNDEDFLLKITKINVDNSLKILYARSPVVRDLVESNNINLVGAIYDVKSGVVTFDGSIKDLLNEYSVGDEFPVIQ